MSNDTPTTIIGTLTRDPEVRYSQAGKAWTSFGIARNDRVRNDRGEWEDGAAHFFDIKAFGPLAENIGASLRQGDRAVVYGQLRYETWENDAGEKRSRVIVVADACGPDLLWATAQPEKVSRSNDSRDRGGAQRPRQPRSEASDPFGAAGKVQEAFPGTQPDYSSEAPF